ncbi:hypothetical protein EXIGLDRAFT_781588 [Exidia glandulosa HHB12029]|uniref:Uncharacterized protein n=1 Tax=Exidia glandulosa HHB12029 TaxID=1314781 RepID=A0A165B728_EXIGL|nr:hypothetical protein EXIGLDRAFT_781588 [Exidia glandulosa HHB12029]
MELLPVELLVMVAEELDCLLDVTLLLLVSKTLRHKLVVRMDALVKELAEQWMVPPVDDLAALERAAKDQGRGFPWVKYAHTCAFKSPSMRNRRRIFGICEQIARIAERDDLDDEQLGDDVEVEEASTA